MEHECGMCTFLKQYKGNTKTKPIQHEIYVHTLRIMQTQHELNKRAAIQIEHNPTTIRAHYECIGKTLRKHDITDVIRTQFQDDTNAIRAQYDTQSKTMRKHY